MSVPPRRRTFRRDLTGQVVVITGAARGIGAALAAALARRGARIALVGLERDELKRATRDVPGEAAHWYADVTDADALRDVAAGVTARFGKVDVVVANAGVATRGLFSESEDAIWRRVIEVNLVGSAVTCRTFLPSLADSRGYFLQIASLAAVAPSPAMSAYCASKSGVEAFAHCLRPEVRPLGVRVGIAYLSWTDTDMVRGADEDPTLAAMRAKLPWPANRTYPLGPAVERIASGIERRAGHIYAQRWLPALVPVRGFLPGLVAGPLGRRQIRRFGARLAAGGARGLAGDGGRAAESPRP
ncbi:SDR family oxidoreductase [Streptomyces sp. DSM 44917]|uniref:SDR family oxidoreductase n=1 Tax=Streptomyces boetiae TaxID=3075541 RepID=A0ABU2L5X1_9ACTN|nr:SDR family oxidoreductase [Streptomyces sp. DSM 44917]MDT0306897.1 SDR family oxidoreductase [Streptomyces sp. DSM 44917]